MSPTATPLETSPKDSSKRLEELEWTGERLVPTLGGQIASEHLHRYGVAARLCEGKDVLDIACGEGYGSALLADRARSVVGVDIDERTVLHAREKYQRGNLKFLLGECVGIPVGDASVDLVVSFETVEHIKEQKEFLAEIRRVLRPGGVLIISTPEQVGYDQTLESKNAFHVRELSRAEFHDLVAGCFRNISLLAQRFMSASALFPESEMAADFGVFSGGYEGLAFSKSVSTPTYLLAVCSDDPLPGIAAGIFELDEREQSKNYIPPLYVQLYGDKEGHYSEAMSHRAAVHCGEWMDIRFDGCEQILQAGASRIRIDPLNQQGLVTVRKIRILALDGTVACEYTSEEKLNEVECHGGLSAYLEGEGLLFLGTFPDPQMYLSCQLDPSNPPSVVELTLKVDTTLEGMAAAQYLIRDAHAARILRPEKARFLELAQVNSAAHAALASMRAELDSERSALSDTRAALSASEAHAEGLTGQVQRLEAELAFVERKLQSAYGSLSWRVTRPLRRLDDFRKRLPALRNGAFRSFSQFRRSTSRSSNPEPVLAAPSSPPHVLSSSVGAEVADPEGKQESKDLPVLLIGHDACIAGAQILFLTLIREWTRVRAFPFRMILGGDGPLRQQYEALCPTLVLSDYSDEGERAKAVDLFLNPRPKLVYSNTVVNGRILKELQAYEIPTITHVHEMQKSIERWAPGEIMAETLRHTDHFIACSGPVAENLTLNHGTLPKKVTMIESFIDTERPTISPEAAGELRKELELLDSDIPVFGCGTPDWRKGPDLFIAAAKAASQDARLRYYWIGGISEEDRKALEDGAQWAGIRETVRFLGARSNPRDYFSLGGIFFLSSREDPFPLVALEAADAGLPIVCFAEAGGMPEFVGADCGIVTPFADSDAAAKAILSIAADEDLRLRLGANARRKVAQRNSARKAALRIATVINGVARSAQSESASTPPLATVIVPNYNHSEFLPERLHSLSNQKVESLEILLLDDASNDDSVVLLSEFARTDPRAILLVNESNSGSTFVQWKKALLRAKGKYIWIAESDDSADPLLLATAIERMEWDDSIALVYCQSEMIDTNGAPLGLPMDWVSDLGAERWTQDYINDGRDEIRRFLRFKNVIPNASAVVFRNFSGLPELVQTDMRLCADWLFWIRLAARGNVAFISKPLNLWRLNSSNARTRPPGELEWEEGRIVLNAVSSLLGLSKEEEESQLQAFRGRCEEWKRSV